jgi:hypothetical protein
VSLRRPGACLVGAAALFWLSWLLMPGVGVTDTQRIFELVGASRPAVLASVALQLVSAALYAPALIGLAAHPTLGARSDVRLGAALLAIGAMGSAADAVLHLLAYAMTAPGRDRVALAPVMEFMQGPGLALLAPLLLAFFAGSVAMSLGLARAGMLPPRLVGRATLATVSAAQVWLGLALGARRS